MLSLLTLCLGLAGANTVNRFSLIGATRTLTQLFSYEAPVPAGAVGSGTGSGHLADQPGEQVRRPELVDDADPADWFFGCAGRVDGQAGTVVPLMRPKPKLKLSPAR